MIRTSVLHQSQVLMPQEDHIQSPDCNFRLREQEFVSLLKKCKNLAEFKQVHAQMIKLDLLWSSFCANNLVVTCALSDWGSMDYACSIFRQIDDPGSYVFNNMIRGHVNYLNLKEAIFLYKEMLERGVEPNNFTYPTLLKACTNLEALKEGKQIHGHIFKLGLEHDVFVQNSLINMYGKCEEIERSCAIFEKMDQRTIASWSALISAHASLGLWCECLKLFRDMNNEGCWRAEESVLVSIISACTHLGAVYLGRCTHGYLLRNMSRLNVAVETSLIDVYVKCGSLEKGLSLFHRMENKNQLSYSVMISGLALHGHSREAQKVFSEMLERGLEPDDVVYVGLLSACSHAGLVELGLQLFERMRFEHGVEPTIQHYGCMIDLLGRAGKLKEAYELIKSMPLEPNDVVWRSLLNSCRLHQDVKIGEIAAKRLFLLNTCNAGDYVMLSNLYAQDQRWKEMAMTRKEMASRGLSQAPGHCLVEVKRRVYKFVSQDRSHLSPCSGVNEMHHQMEWQLRFEGYSPDTSQVLFDVDEDEKRQLLSRHSQKLAIAFALLNTSQGSPIRIVRNLRMCSDCHTYTKFISTIYEREIIVRERNTFHHFKDGSCSCKDYW